MHEPRLGYWSQAGRAFSWPLLCWEEGPLPSSQYGCRVCKSSAPPTSDLLSSTSCFRCSVSLESPFKQARNLLPAFVLDVMHLQFAYTITLYLYINCSKTCTSQGIIKPITINYTECMKLISSYSCLIFLIIRTLKIRKSLAISDHIGNFFPENLFHLFCSFPK